MKKIYFILSVLFILNLSQTKAQQAIDSTTTRAQNVFVELAGQGISLSANYDSRFGKRRNGIGGRIGIGYISGGGDKATTIPVGLNYLLGKGKHFFEIGLGATYFSAKLNDEIFNAHFNNIVGTASFSYRSQPLKNGFAFRAGITPLFGNNFFFPYYGISLGYTF